MHSRFFAIGLCLAGLAPFAAESPRVTAMRAPHGGIQPQAAVDSRGVVHVIYYKGDAGGGDVFYVRQQPGEANFSKPIRVNSQPGSAIAAGSIRGAQLALGKNDRPHVVWNGGKGAQKVTVAGKEVTPLLYTRLTANGSAFEPERNLITRYAGLDGGSAVAADQLGNVSVFWHGSAPDNTDKEAGRAVFVARSSDDGATFAPEIPALAKRTGACACCGMKAVADSRGAVFALFRPATGMMERGETLVVSPKPGAPFEAVFTDPWHANKCPMSSASIFPTPSGALLGWETGDAIRFASLDAQTLTVSKPKSPVGGAKRKHPVATANARGDVLWVWTEGTAWAKGGSVAWQLNPKENSLAPELGRAEGLPVWSLPTAYARADGTFVVMY
jgi:hypothetical protein